MLRLAAGGIAGYVILRQQWRYGHLGRARYTWAMFAIVGIVTLVAGILPTVHDRLRRPGAPSVLVASWAATIYCCIPETGRQPGLLAMVFGLTAWQLLGRTTLPWQANFAQIFLLVSSGVFGTAGWASALLGALFGAWPFALVAGAATIADQRADSTLTPRHLEVIAALGCIGSIVVARTGALVHPGIRGAMTAIVIVAAVTSVATVALLVLSPARRAVDQLV